ncbi:MAG: monovalent cation/H(+) antiporter subunit G [Cellulomonadaceae bacterium]|jgi:multicomponent Na+:H+ antiporter subunit G|nr:monovalent cation/H(+) antiporter subunit G [Cellulomonadaceae bacterium]
MWITVANVLSGVLLVLGAFLTLSAGVGVVRFPTLLSRMHAVTKPQVLGLIFLLVALELRLRTWTTFSLVVLVIAFQLLTQPVAAHMVARAALRSGKVEETLE